jgi:hypothetical protein
MEAKECMNSIISRATLVKDEIDAGNSLVREHPNIKTGHWEKSGPETVHEVAKQDPNKIGPRATV